MKAKIIVLALCLVMTGCLFTVDSRQVAGSSQWTSAEVERIRVGQTDAEWLTRTFGPPQRQSSYADGSEVWRYRNSKESESKVGLFLLFNVRVEREDTETLVLELKDGVVSDFWTERG